MKQTELRKHFVESLYETLAGVVSPTPYLEITEGDKVNVRFLDGKGQLPKEGSIEHTTLDFDIASLFFDEFRLLKEGVTGVGKTYTSDALFQTVMGPDGHYTIRLGGGLLGASALEPFTTTILDEGGMPKTEIDHDKCQRIGGLIIDEINRGDSQEVFQVVDGKIHVNGDTGYLQIPIPNTDQYKKLAIIAAMNPADGQHSSALELDIAGENRFLKLKFPNGVDEAASSQLDKKTGENLHQQFWNLFRTRTGLEGTWRELYPTVTDSEALEMKLQGDVREFIDVALSYVAKDPVSSFDRNRKLMEAGDYTCKLTIRANNDVNQIKEIQKNLKHGFVRRDLVKISDLSKILAFLKSVKNDTYEPAVTLHDVAASIGVVLESKQITGAQEGGLMTLVNDALKSYQELRKSVKAVDDYGIRQAVWQAAVLQGTKEGFDAYQGTIQKGITTLNTQIGSVAGSVLKSRLVADLVVLDHFSKKYQTEIGQALKSESTFEAIRKVYDTNKKSASIYEHRLDSILR